MRPRPSKREEPSNAVVRARRRSTQSSTWSGVSGATLTHASARHARAAGGAIAARPPALAVLLVAHEAPRARAGDDIRAPRVVAGGAVEEVRQPRAPQVGAVQRVLDEQRRTQRLGRPHAGNAQLADAARTALAGRRLDDVRDLHAQRAHAAQTQVQPVPPVAHGELRAR